jgi:hypothetical protein
VPCPPQVLKLSEKFELHREAYHSAGYKEAQLRQEFIDPLFAALGCTCDASQHRELTRPARTQDAVEIHGRGEHKQR